MARDGYLILDSDLHMMEPDDLWVRYLDEPYRSSNPPRFFGGQLQKLAEKFRIPDLCRAFRTPMVDEFGWPQDLAGRQLSGGGPAEDGLAGQRGR